MSRTRTDEDRVDRSWIVFRGITGNHLDMREIPQVRQSALRQFYVEFERRHSTVAPNHMRNYRCIVPRPAAGMDDMLALLNVHRVDRARYGTGQSVIETPRRIDRHQNVIVKMRRVGVAAPAISRAREHPLA